MTTTGLKEIQLAYQDWLSMLTRITSANSEVAIRNHEAILKMTEDVFPGAKVDVEQSVDPEIENYEHIAIVVVTKGDVDELVAGNREWHRRLRAAAPDTARHYVLSLSAA
jgi:hypothetical protein